MNGRFLHFVLKVANRTRSAKFYRQVLGMKVLRHEEFKEGCEAACNGPYDNRWSKTMVGYGPEDSHFVIELTYNYNVDSYKRGNDFIGITINSMEAIARAKVDNWPYEEKDGATIVKSPGGYKFYLNNVYEEENKDHIKKVSLACSNLQASIAYWNGILGLEIFSETPNSVVFGFSEDQVKLELKEISEPIDRRTAYGRIAFSVPGEKLPEIQKKIEARGHTVLTPLISLDTPGKATVSVVILADPDGHEICFVDDENFRKLSEFDPKGDSLLNRYIEKDDSRKKEAKEGK